MSDTPMLVKGSGAWRMIAVGICTAAVVLWVWSRSGRLDDLENICRSELVKSARMAGTTHLAVYQHYDFWTKTISGGGFVAPWISHPYETPKVSLVVNFTRDGETRSGWVDCIFSQIPNTGDPPRLAFQKINPWIESVFVRVGDQYRWMPPSPGASAKVDAHQ